MNNEDFKIGSLVRLKKKDNDFSQDFYERNKAFVGIIAGFNTGADGDIRTAGPPPEPSEKDPYAQILWEEGCGLSLHWRLKDIEIVKIDTSQSTYI